MARNTSCLSKYFSYKTLMLFLTARNIVIRATLMVNAEANHLTSLAVLNLPNGKPYQVQMNIVVEGVEAWRSFSSMLKVSANHPHILEKAE